MIVAKHEANAPCCQHIQWLAVTCIAQLSWTGSSLNRFHNQCTGSLPGFWLGRDCHLFQGGMMSAKSLECHLSAATCVYRGHCWAYYSASRLCTTACLAAATHSQLYAPSSSSISFSISLRDAANASCASDGQIFVRCLCHLVVPGSATFM
jgi:hypothetical protein